MAGRERLIERRNERLDEAEALVETLRTETSARKAQETANRIYERVDSAVADTRALEEGDRA